MALGIATFCIISLVSLLPLGLNVVQNSQEQAAGAPVLNQLATDIRKAIPETNGDHRACGIYSNIVWRDQTETFTMNDISLGGTRTTLPLDQRLTAYVRIEPSTTSASGRAFISVAWPNRASWGCGPLSMDQCPGVGILLAHPPPRPVKPRRQQGFTMVELLVATAVMALLLTLLLQISGNTLEFTRASRQKMDAMQRTRAALGPWGPT